MGTHREMLETHAVEQVRKMHREEVDLLRRERSLLTAEYKAEVDKAKYDAKCLAKENANILEAKVAAALLDERKVTGKPVDCEGRDVTEELSLLRNASKDNVIVKARLQQTSAALQRALLSQQGTAVRANALAQGKVVALLRQQIVTLQDQSFRQAQVRQPEETMSSAKTESQEQSQRDTIAVLREQLAVLQSQQTLFQGNLDKANQVAALAVASAKAERDSFKKVADKQTDVLNRVQALLEKVQNDLMCERKDKEEIQKRLNVFESRANGDSQNTTPEAEDVNLANSDYVVDVSSPPDVLQEFEEEPKEDRSLSTKKGRPLGEAVNRECGGPSSQDD
jgi:hypothetical protein